MNGLPADALPLSDAQANSLQVAVGQMSAQQLQWVSGYVAGLAAAAASPAAAAAPAPLASTSAALTILYGSQTGNGEELATALLQQIQGAGYSANCLSLADYKPARLKRESSVIFVISTHGEGDPPDDAELFYEYLMAAKAPQLDSLQYAVLALGDSSYVNFCQTGREFDARLAELGAHSFAPLAECDLDYDDDVSAWSQRVVAELPELLQLEPAPVAPLLRAVQNVASFNRRKPFLAEVLVNQKITGGSSSKDVRHIELSLQGSGMHYEPGDALAVVAENPPQLIDELMQLLVLDSSTDVTLGDDVLPLSAALLSRLEITALNVAFLRQWAVLSASQTLVTLLSDGNQDALSTFIGTHQIIDVVREFATDIDAQGFVDTLRKLSPRSYSISSSLAANPDEVHLTVAAVRYRAFDHEHWGAASTQLADRLEEGDKVPVFIEKNTRFRLPQTDVPVIMIGPGTGVAPFRAFIEERKEQGASGDNWLFFGDRNFDSDFLYQLEWQRHLKNGALQRLDVAFSRDQKNKIYVQDRLREQGAELNRWVDAGASIYLCGDAKHMAGDVHEALIDVFEQHGNLPRAAAQQKLKELRAAGRYQRDVY